AALTIGASVVPITNAAATGSSSGREKKRQTTSSRTKIPTVAICAAGAQTSSRDSGGSASLTLNALSCSRRARNNSTFQLQKPVGPSRGTQRHIARRSSHGGRRLRPPTRGTLAGPRGAGLFPPGGGLVGGPTEGPRVRACALL